jgi:hypothetical protein
VAGKATLPSLIIGALRSPVIFISVFVIIINGVYILHTPLHAMIAAASTVLCIVFAVITRKRTEYYTRMLGQLRGFANFIETAESDRLKMLVDENPNYFFDILPYAWAMGLTYEWDDKFNRFGLTVIPQNVVISSSLSVLDIESVIARRNTPIASLGRKRGSKRKYLNNDYIKKSVIQEQSLISFSVRRKRLDLFVTIAFFLIFTGLFVQEIIRFRNVLIEGSPFPGLSHFQAATTEFWANQIAGLILFFVLWLVALFFLLAAARWRILVEGDMLTIQKTFGKKMQMHIGEISGVDIRNDAYIILRGTKALTKVKPTDKNFNALMIRLGVIK